MDADTTSDGGNGKGNESWDRSISKAATKRYGDIGRLSCLSWRINTPQTQDEEIQVVIAHYRSSLRGRPAEFQRLGR